MARAKPSEQPRNRAKPSLVEELTRGMAKLHELSAQIDDLSRDGFSFGEAVRARTELSLRETIRRHFGEKSTEYQTHKNHKLRIGTRGESGQSTGLLKELIAVLENQKADLLGLKPTSPVTPPPPSNEPTRLRAVPPRPSSDSTPAPDALGAPPVTAVTMASAPVTGTVAMMTTLEHSASVIVPTVMSPRPETTLTESAAVCIDEQPPAQVMPVSLPAAPVPPAQPASAIPSSSSIEDRSSPPAAIPNAASFQAVIPQETVRTSPQPTEPAAIIPTSPADPLLPSSNISAPTGILPQSLAKDALSHRATVQAIAPAPIEKSPNDSGGAVPPAHGSSSRQEQSAPVAMGSSAVLSALGAPDKIAQESERPSPSTEPGVATVSTLQGRTEDDTLDMLRRICTRFHLVARQLRLRKEYRPTLEINDEYDLQDLFYALLRLQFDEVGTEEWSPGYANGAQRTTYLLDWDRTAVVVKQTRSGLNTRDFAEQVKTDAAYYSARPNGKALLCFIYDPEGRVGNPRGLEADLTTVSDMYTVEVIVAPK